MLSQVNLDCGKSSCGAERVVRRERTVPLSPRLALRRVLVLAEGRQFREAAAVLARLGPTGLAVIASELPLDILVESLPHSAQLLETLFTKLNVSGQRPSIAADTVLWQLVRLLASYEDDPTLKSKIAKLAHSLIEWQPDYCHLLLSKRKTFEQAVEGLGCHGLTTTDATQGLLHLHVALKMELHRHIDVYKNALHRIDELNTTSASSSLSSSSTMKSPTDASHHRLLSLPYADVQQRLIDNKTLLTVLEKPALGQLRSLIGTLASRVQNDKQALFCVSQLKRRMQPNVAAAVIGDEQPVASLLMSFARGCSALMQLIQQNSVEASVAPTMMIDSNSDGYHSETDTELEETIIDRYRSLYMQKRPRALEALDSLPELLHATQLKSKILFSVVILAFRSCRNLRETKLEEVCQCLHLMDHLECEAVTHFRCELIRCLASTVNTFPLDSIEQHVHRMVCGTLKEYNCLTHCTALYRYIADVVRVCWMIVNQSPINTYQLDMDFTVPVQFQGHKHVRHHSADKHSVIVRSYLWPALLFNGHVVHKAIVIT